MTGPLVVRPISAAEHLQLVRSRTNASYLQCPSWGVMPPRWTAESVGWFDGPALVGAGLVLYRSVPAVGSLAYVGEGPVVDFGELERSWSSTRCWPTCGRDGSSRSRSRPTWSCGGGGSRHCAGCSGPRGPARLRDVPPDEVGEVATSVVGVLRDRGWTQYEAPGPGFGGQIPRYRSYVPLSPDADPAERLDSQWRRNLRKASPPRASTCGSEVWTTCRPSTPCMRRPPAGTASRRYRRSSSSGCGPRYARRTPTGLALYLSGREGVTYAAALRTRVGTAVSYTHGASGSAGREWRPSNALQWRMLQDAHAVGASVYDLRGISDTLDPGDPLFGLLRFKTGLGGDAVEMVGEWDFPPVRPPSPRDGVPRPPRALSRTANGRTVVHARR